MWPPEKNYVNGNGNTLILISLQALWVKKFFEGNQPPILFLFVWIITALNNITTDGNELGTL